MGKPKAFQIYGINKGIYYTHKRIAGNGTFQAEHEHLVPVFSLFVLHELVWLV
jgi:hypothetical protein